MKKILSIIVLAITFVSCNNFLDLQPEHQMNANSFYKNENDFQTALTGAYSSLRSWSTSQIWVGNLATDDGEIQLGNPSTHEIEFSQVAFTSSNSYISTYWNVLYSMISRTNTILGRIEPVSMPDASKSRIKAEAKFLRGYAYFQLILLFGDVSLIDVEFTSPNQIFAYDMTRKPKEEIYQFILQDLTEAEGALGNSIPANKGQASAGAVKMLLAQIYLTQKEYGKAEAKLREIMGFNTYSLVNNYASMFTKGNNDLAESVFEAEFAPGNLGLGNGLAFHFYPLIQGMAVFANNELGGGRCVPTADLVNSYTGNDARKEMFGDQIPLANGTTIQSRFCKKFADYTASSIGDGSCNIILYRYADVLLSLAESLNEQNKPAEAVPLINRVRQRAGLEPLAVSSQTAVREALLNERRWEFAFEAHRWFDLLRAGKTIEVMNAFFASTGMKITVDKDKLVLPIPLRELTINPDLKQNPGY